MSAQSKGRLPLDPRRVVARPLKADDSDAYFALRDTILEIGDGKYFSDSYTRERELISGQQRRSWCAEAPDHCIIGTFIDEELVGVMMITRQGPPGSPIVEWEATWLDPEFRGHGLAKPAYEAVAQWTKDHGYKYAVVYIRDENERSQEIRQKQNFIYLYTKEPETWADGSDGVAHCGILDLHSTDHRGSVEATIRRLGVILAALRGEVPSLEAGIGRRIETLRKMPASDVAPWPRPARTTNPAHRHRRRQKVVEA